jgi:glutathione peroxidase
MHKAMMIGLGGLLILGGLPCLARAGEKGDKRVAPVLNFKMNSLAGQPVDLSRYQGKVVLIVNVASECGYTPQYKGLQALHEKHAAQGLAILGIPSNDFGGQEPGTNEKIANFCKQNYGVQFDMFAKVAVKGKEQTPLYKFLTGKDTNPGLAGPVRWNFEKFLIGRDGAVVARFASDVEPDSDELMRALLAELAKK